VVRDTLFDSGCIYGFLYADFVASWQGAGNVYRLVQPGFLETAQRNGWKEVGSVEREPHMFQPQVWRLLPGQPKRPDGNDYGADVDRMAPVRSRP
jgi:hypothetical protein